MKKITLEKFIDRANKIHNKRYDYSLVNYKNILNKIKIICPIHGEFEQSVKTHMNGSGCSKCKGKYKLTKNRFIEFSNKIHNNKYDYSLMEDYKNMRTKIKIICPIHGVFEQSSDNHLKGCGCPECGSVKIPSTKEYISKVKIKHKNKYDYSLVIYKNAYTKIKIICPIHGVFEQKATNHLSGQGCAKCVGKNKSVDEIIDMFNKKHNYKYDYSLVEYKNRNTKIKIICKIHGIFEQAPKTHLNYGCSQCGKSKKKTKNEFVEQSNKIHNNKYDYSLAIYKNAHTKIKIICPVHGIFEQRPCNHTKGVGCPSCRESHGEKEIKKILDKKNISFIYNKRYKECRYKNPLPFDFYLPDYNICIEYDGEQHFRSWNRWGGDEALRTQKIRDKIKTDFCAQNNITLIRISYNENILEKLNSIF